ncbi:MAG: PAS domain S-box protein [Acidobacteriota bacterium]|nr:PAS domain S-box protein [Acidobacteriota bacterium]
MQSFPRPPWLRYGVAALCVLFATLLRLWLRTALGENFPFITYFIAVVFVAWLYRLWPALAATAMGAAAADYFFMPPYFSFALASPGDVGAILIFVMSCVAVALLFEEMHRARHRAEVLASIVNSSEDAIIGKTLDGTITSWNKGAERLYGYTAAEALGRNISMLVPPTQADELPQITERVARGEHVEPFETARATKDGRTIYVSLTLSPVRDADGQVVGASAIARDVTERKRAEAERQLLLESERGARESAEEASRLKDDFLATVSHELRTPLTAIHGWALLLASGQLDAAGAARAVEVIERNARAQKQIINDLLDVSRIISGKMRLDVRRVELGTILSAAVESVRPAARAKEIELQTRLDAPAAQVSGDPERLQQVFWNLLTNAVKFTPEGGRVSVELAHVNGHAEVMVKDTGAGISPDFRPYVFDRFRQGDSSTTRAHGGLGLGLSIVRHLVELHGGTVTAESEGEGRGSTFAVELPLLRAAELGARVEAGANGLDAGSAARDPRPAILRGLRVLVVDDDQDALQLVSALLGQHGALVSTAVSTADALARLEREGADVIVSDIAMPERDGYDFMRELRARESARGSTHTPAIALTAYARAEDRARALAEGYQSHIAKPAEPSELLAVVAALGKSEQPL